MKKIQIEQINSTDVQQLGDLEATNVVGGSFFDNGFEQLAETAKEAADQVVDTITRELPIELPLPESPTFPNPQVGSEE